MPLAVTTPASDAGIPDKERKTIAEGLSRVLADTYTLYLKTHGFHWNVTGPMFQTLHTMFEQQYTELALAVDLIAERTSTQDPSRGGLVDTQYESLGLRGNITGDLFYNGFFALNTGRTLSYVSEGTAQGSYRYTPILAGAGGLGLTLYAEKVLGSVAGLRVLLSSGDSWVERTSVNEGSLSATPGLFLPVTGRPQSAVFAPTLGNIAFVEASYSIRPFAAAGSDLLAMLQIGATGLVFIRPVAGPVSVTLPNAASTSAYLGSEFDLSVAFRPFSDLGFNVSAGLFLPNSVAGGPFEGGLPWWRVDVSASLSL